MWLRIMLVRGLHDDQRDDQGEIVAPQVWQLSSGIERQLPEIGQYCYDQENRSDDLNGKQSQVSGFGVAQKVENRHCCFHQPVR
jgi:hypothetical protein